MNSPPTYSLLSSTRYDKSLLGDEWNTAVNDGVPSPFLLLPYHFDRLADAARQHGWTERLTSISRNELARVCTDAITSATVQYGDVPMKLRILLSADGMLSAVASPAMKLQSATLLVPPSSPPSSTCTERIVYIDPKATSPSIFTSTKTTQRVIYNDARSRVGLTPLPSPSDAHIDVLLHTPDGLITETSIRNVAFDRSDSWITPTSNTGCLPGVMRRLLLEKGVVTEANITLDDVVPGEIVLTFNGVEGCFLARIAAFSQ